MGELFQTAGSWRQIALGNIFPHNYTEPAQVTTFCHLACCYLLKGDGGSMSLDKPCIICHKLFRLFQFIYKSYISFNIGKSGAKTTGANVIENVKRCHSPAGLWALWWWKGASVWHSASYRWSFLREIRMWHVWYTDNEFSWWGRAINGTVEKSAPLKKISRILIQCYANSLQKRHKNCVVRFARQF